VWGVVLLLIGGLGPLIGFYELQVSALAVFTFGTLMFVLGSLIGDLITRHIEPGRPQNIVERLNYVGLAQFAVLAHLVMIPLWWADVKNITEGADSIFALAFELRYQAVTTNTTVGPLVGNYLLLGYILLPVLLVGALRKEISGWAVVAVGAPWVLQNLLTNGRAGTVLLFLVGTYIAIVMGRRIRIRVILASIVGFMALFGAGAILVGKSGIQADVPALDTAYLVLKNLVDYIVAGPILFSEYLSDKKAIVPSWDALVFPCQLLAKIGACTVPPQHQDFLDFGSNDQVANVYSVYFSIYPRYGIAGVTSITFVYGAWTAYHHSRNKDVLSFLHLVIGGYLFSATVLSIFSDYFFPSLYFFIKVVIFCFCLSIVTRAKFAMRLAQA
jgi:oligosaccharide repeat unit polymerase